MLRRADGSERMFDEPSDSAYTVIYDCDHRARAQPNALETIEISIIPTEDKLKEMNEELDGWLSASNPPPASRYQM